jgi:hypothetical protein
VCFKSLSQETTIFFLDSILVFIAEMSCVSCEARTEFLYTFKRKSGVIQWVSEWVKEWAQPLLIIEGVTSSSQTPRLVERRPHFKSCVSRERNFMVMGPKGAQNKEWLCWRGSAEIYWTRLDWTGQSYRVKQYDLNEHQQHRVYGKDRPMLLWIHS